MGNHEQGLINIIYLRGFNQPAADVLRRTREMISEETYQWLTTRPKAIVEHGCRFVHGLPPDSITEYLWKYRDEMAGVFARYGEDVCFVGHTHDLMRYTCLRGEPTRHALPEGETVLERGVRHLVNIGAVGQPRDGDNRAKYGVFDLDTRVLTMRFIPYDIKKTADLIVALGFHRGFADRLW
jgi:diadenosine tetraphosphatase ApaH/serine/threonine PP2A family protein phosphatase